MAKHDGTAGTRFLKAMQFSKTTLILPFSHVDEQGWKPYLYWYPSGVESVRKLTVQPLIFEPAEASTPFGGLSVFARCRMVRRNKPSPERYGVTDGETGKLEDTLPAFNVAVPACGAR